MASAAGDPIGIDVAKAGLLRICALSSSAWSRDISALDTSASRRSFASWRSSTSSIVSICSRSICLRRCDCATASLRRRSCSSLASARKRSFIASCSRTSLRRRSLSRCNCVSSSDLSAWSRSSASAAVPWSSASWAARCLSISFSSRRLLASSWIWKSASSSEASAAILKVSNVCVDASSFMTSET
eukprot:scaffold1299_cov246-Pinguiococcus_pyrenoidosus.AAC.9